MNIKITIDDHSDVSTMLAMKADFRKKNKKPKF